MPGTHRHTSCSGSGSSECCLSWWPCEWTLSNTQRSSDIGHRMEATMRLLYSKRERVCERETVMSHSRAFCLLPLSVSQLLSHHLAVLEGRKATRKHGWKEGVREMGASAWENQRPRLLFENSNQPISAAGEHRKERETRRGWVSFRGIDLRSVCCIRKHWKRLDKPDLGESLSARLVVFSFTLRCQVKLLCCQPPPDMPVFILVVLSLAVDTQTFLRDTTLKHLYWKIT